MKPVRVRFAPSPTGALHIGGVRTALYNYLLARQTGGTMILRIEDTDQERFVPGAEQYILDSLKWAGIEIDEGVGAGGPYAPYRQSERKEMYHVYAQQLVQAGHAYYAFDTAEELDAMRERLKSAGAANQQYGSQTRLAMRNSLTLPPDEVSRLLQQETPYVIRLKMPGEGEIKLNDLIRGEVVFQAAQVDDKVLMKSDGMPTYHLANVVDDYLMKISHVIRGEEWLPSAPLHVTLYKMLGWQNNMPQFAHLPLLLKPDGHGKLSKRDADQLGFPIFPLNWQDPRTKETSRGYREWGYLPEAVINFLALLGWNPGTEQELFSRNELIQIFSLDRINKAGARFDIHKAQWFNQHYLRAQSDDVLAGYLLASLKENQISCAMEKALAIVRVLRERITFPADFWEQGKFFFRAPAEYDPQVVTKKWTAPVAAALDAYRIEMENVRNLTHTEAKQKLDEVCARLQVKTGQVLQPLRTAITGGASGPDLMVTLEILGSAEVATRLATALTTIKPLA
jgi:glutamyl-tRNA synthetase